MAKSSRRRARKARKLSIREQLARNHAFEALSLMRSRGLSLTAAAKAAGDNGVSRSAALHHVGAALYKVDHRYRAHSSDRLMRSLRFVTETGQIDVEVRGSKKASLIARYFSALGSYLGGDKEPLRAFEGKSIRIGKTVYPFVTDRDLIERLYFAGQLPFENFYPLKA